MFYGLEDQRGERRHNISEPASQRGAGRSWLNRRLWWQSYVSEEARRLAGWDLSPDLVGLADHFIRAVRSSLGVPELRRIIEAVTREMGFKYYALVHYDDLRVPRSDRVDIKDYPQAVVERFLDQGRYRRDPIVRAFLVAGGAFRWSEIGDLIQLDRNDRLTLEFGAREALNEGITVPYK